MPSVLPRSSTSSELRTLPLAAPHRRVRRRHVPCKGEQQRQRVLGRGDGVAGRRIDDSDAGVGRGGEVDVVDADPGPADDRQALAGGDCLGVDLDLAAHEQGVVLGQDAQELAALEPGPYLDVMVGTQDRQPFLCEGLGDQDAFPVVGGGGEIGHLDPRRSGGRGEDGLSLRRAASSAAAASAAALAPAPGSPARRAR